MIFLTAHHSSLPFQEVEVMHLQILLGEAAAISMTTNLQEAKIIVLVRGVYISI